MTERDDERARQARMTQYALTRALVLGDGAHTLRALDKLCDGLPTPTLRRLRASAQRVFSAASAYLHERESREEKESTS